MKHKLICFAAVLVPLAVARLAAQTQAVPATNDASPTPETAKDEASPNPAQQRLQAAIDRLAGYEWIAAGLRQQVDVFNKRFTATGRHLQGPGNRLRRELQVSVDGQTSSLLQVCDGNLFFLRQDVQGESEQVQIGQVQVEDVMNVLEEHNDPELNEAILRAMGLTRLEQFLKGLQNSFVFETEQAGDLDGRKVYILSGKWNPSVVERYRGRTAADAQPQAPLLEAQPEVAQQQEEKAAERNRLPSYVPDTVELYLGQDDMVPYRVDFLKQTEDGTPRLLTRVELIDVTWDVPIDNEEFQYVLPVGVEPENYTNNIIAQVRVLAQALAAQRAQQPATQSEERGPSEEPGLPSTPAGEETGSLGTPEASSAVEQNPPAEPQPANSQ